jgi:hypothetical protein
MTTSRRSFRIALALAILAALNLIGAVAAIIISMLSVRNVAVRDWHMAVAACFTGLSMALVALANVHLDTARKLRKGDE